MTCKNPLAHPAHEYLADSDAITLTPCRGRAETRTAEDHARLIRRAIADAVADGFVVDFDWRGWGATTDMSLKVCHEDINWKEAKLIWPIV